MHHGDRQPWTLGLGGSLGLYIFFGLKEGGQQPDFLSIPVYTEYDKGAAWAQSRLEEREAEIEGSLYGVF